MMKKSSSGDQSTKPDRKTVERNRRIQMKDLCSKLSSLIPPQYHRFEISKEILSQQDQLDHAASYIKHLKQRIDKLEKLKAETMLGLTPGSSGGDGSGSSSSRTLMGEMVATGLRLPIFELRDNGSSIEVFLISGLNKNFMLYEVISILEEEGAEVVCASFSTVGDKIFHTIHAQARLSRVGVETTRVRERLQELIY